MAKFGRFDHRNKKKDRNQKNSINRVKRIKETEDDWYNKIKFKQTVEKLFVEDPSKTEGTQEQ
jgi:hypothetical protein